jgi:CPA2 family monovalent cation:H+ antiporter-2
VEHNVIAEAVALIVAAALIAYACFRLGLVPIVGFLVAGVVIGPHALGLVRDQATVDQAAEIGVMFRSTRSASSSASISWRVSSG